MAPRKTRASRFRREPPRRSIHRVEPLLGGDSQPERNGPDPNVSLVYTLTGPVSGLRRVRMQIIVRLLDHLAAFFYCETRVDFAVISKTQRNACVPRSVSNRTFYFAYRMTSV